MLTLLFVRHASHGLLGRVLAGRMDGVGLSAAGQEEAERVARRLADPPLDAILTSPRQRAVETAEALAARQTIRPEIDPALDEIDCGAWTGRTFDDLAAEPSWQAWNASRATAAVPDGETMAAVQGRIMGLVGRLTARSDGRIALVSHADVIKAGVCAVLGLSLDRFDSFAVDPASVTTIGFWGPVGRLLCLNEAAS